MQATKSPEAMAGAAEKVVSLAKKLNFCSHLRAAEGKASEGAEKLGKLISILIHDEVVVEPWLRVTLLEATHSNLLCLLLMAGNMEEATEQAQKVMELQHAFGLETLTSAAVHLNICSLLSQMKQHFDALKHAEYAVSLLQRQAETCAPKRLPGDYAALLVASHFSVGVQKEYLHIRDAVLSYSLAMQIATASLGINHPMIPLLRKGRIESDGNRGGAVSVDYWIKWNRSAGCLQGSKSLRLDGAHARIWPASELRKQNDVFKRENECMADAARQSVDEILSDEGKQGIDEFFEDCISHYRCLQIGGRRINGYEHNESAGENKGADISEKNAQITGVSIRSSEESNSSRVTPPNSRCRPLITVDTRTRISFGNHRIKAHQTSICEYATTSEDSVTYGSGAQLSSTTARLEPSNRERTAASAVTGDQLVCSAGVQCELLSDSHSQSLQRESSTSNLPNQDLTGSRGGSERRRVSFSQNAAEIICREGRETSQLEEVEELCFSSISDGPPLNFGESVTSSKHWHVDEKFQRAEEEISAPNDIGSQSGDGDDNSENDDETLSITGAIGLYNVPSSTPKRPSLRTQGQSCRRPKSGRRRVSFQEGAQVRFASESSFLGTLAEDQVVNVTKGYLSRMFDTYTTRRQSPIERRPTPWPRTLTKLAEVKQPTLDSNAANELSNSYVASLTLRTAFASEAASIVGDLISRAITLASKQHWLEQDHPAV